MSNKSPYKKKFIDYIQVYIDKLPPPAPPQPSGGASVASTQKTALTRQARYNDKTSRQSVNNQKGKQNGN